MPNLLTNLKVNRVDLVDEGANSAAFIELYKRKESDIGMTLQEIISKMKPEHAALVQKAMADAEEKLAKVNADLAAKETELAAIQTDLTKTKTDLVNVETDVVKLTTEKTALEKAVEEAKSKSETPFDEAETFKDLPAEARVALIKMRSEKQAAEDALKKANDKQAHELAVAKAATLKSIPLPMEELVDIIKTSPEKVTGMLEVINASINETIMQEIGKSLEGTAITALNAWDKIEKLADQKVAKTEGLTKSKAIAEIVKEQPELYREYLKGGAN